MLNREYDPSYPIIVQEGTEKEMHTSICRELTFLLRGKMEEHPSFPNFLFKLYLRLHYF